MPRLDARVLEVLGILKAQLLHHAARARVSGNGERNDFGQSDALKAILQRRPRSLGGQSLAPPPACQPPTDFDAGGEGRLEGRNRQTDESDKGSLVRHLHCPEAVAMFFEVVLYPANRSDSFLARK